MKRRHLASSSSVALSVIVLAFTRPATADAPVAQYDRFVQTSVEIHDTFTGLTWDRRGVVGGLNEAGAQLYCNQTVFPGAGRLPSVKELLTLVDETPHDHYEGGKIVRRSIDQNAFPDAVTPIDRPYWTSTVGGSGKVFVVNFETGVTDLTSPTDTANTRCVK